jgi:heme A synthase
MSKIHHLLATHLMSSVAILGLTAATPPWPNRPRSNLLPPAKSS